MNYKRMISLFLTFVMTLGLLSGCGSGTKPTASTPEELVAVLDISEIQKEELLYMSKLGFSLDRIKEETISGREMAALLDRLVEYAAPEKLEEWKDLYPAFRSSGKDLTRIDVLSVLFLAVHHIGGNYGYYRVDHSNPMFHAMFADVDAPNVDLFGGFLEFEFEGWGIDHQGIGGYIYNVTRKSPGDGEYPMAYDEEAGSFRMSSLCTYEEALLAVTRAIRLGESASIVSVNDPTVVTPDPHILTPDLLEKAAKNPVVTSEDHPRWTGFVLGQGNENQFDTSVREIELSAEWGFNSVRLNLHYLALFSEDAQTVDVGRLQQLDELVAASIENDIHFNICLVSIPGRSKLNLIYDYNYIGDFDLFINPQKQELALNVYRVLAARYKDVPNFNLSITPIWEALNKDLSTGLPYEDYTPEDAAAFLGSAIDVIREADLDRLVIYEPTPYGNPGQVVEEILPAVEEAEKRGNTLISYNFGESAYISASMTNTEGRNFDDMNNSMYVTDYPNYIYAVASTVPGDVPITINGLLPAGTTIDLYLERSMNGAALDISTNGTSIYSEKLPDSEYVISERLSALYPFATSEKQISVTLAEDTEEIVIACRSDGWFDICGIRLTLPDKYAQERWFYVEPYDVFLGNEEEDGVVLRPSTSVIISPNNYEGFGRKIIIHEDLTYTTEQIWEEASPESIHRNVSAMDEVDGNCVVRFERADFSGTTWSSMKAYYEDLLQSFENYNFGWWSNDWWLMTEEYPQTKIIAECPSTEYAGYEHFNLELLQLLQKYQSKD
ncbi:MAG: hypothetical protein E7487_01545 [Ruminococcaceae bacterium]|nr:hypothetical protein [Oscillospiraceae bacterium]